MLDMDTFAPLREQVRGEVLRPGDPGYGRVAGTRSPGSSAVGRIVLKGAVNRVDPEATAFAERAAQYPVAVDGNWSNPDENAARVKGGIVMRIATKSKARTAALLAAAAVIPGALLAASATGAPPDGDVTEPTWVRDRMATFWADWEAPPASDARYSMFVVGPQDPAHPQEPEHQDPDGSTGPAHDHVLPNIPYGRRATCHVWAVFASETAPAGSVPVRDSGLAYAIDLGDGLQPLTAYRTVTEGLAAGLLRLADPGFPDFTCWTHRR